MFIKNNEGKDAYHFAMQKGDRAMAKEIQKAVKKEINSYRVLTCQQNQNLFMVQKHQERVYA